MNESIAIEQEQAAASPVRRRHSGMGIASFVIGLISVLSIVGVLGLAVAMNVANGGVAPDDTAPQVVMLGLLMILAGMICLVGLGLGIAAAMQKNRRRALGVIGICLNGPVALIFLLVIILGLKAS